VLNTRTSEKNGAAPTIDAAFGITIVVAPAVARRKRRRSRERRTRRMEHLGLQTYGERALRVATLRNP
jgi:hypothetical protein